MKSTTLAEIFLNKRKYVSKGIIFIEHGHSDTFISYSDLIDDSLKVLSFLQSKGISPRDELVFQLEDNKTFITVFWACILGGIIPVPLSVSYKEDHIKKVFEVWKVLSNPFFISTVANIERIDEFAALNTYQSLSLNIKSRFIDVSKVFSSKIVGQAYEVGENDIAFIQFSSGSTGNPKGIVLTHKNLIVNISDIQEASHYTLNDSTLSWMPLTHDMGLIGFHISPLVNNMSQCLMPTTLFIRRPILWLDKVTEYKITVLSSPNFGYKYLLKNMAVERAFLWDLSSVRILYNGAEPISEKLAFEFLDKLARYGLKRNTMCPVYGLAEASLAVTISDLTKELNYCRVSRNSLTIGDEVNILKNDQEGLTIVNVGTPIKNCSLRIVNQENENVNDKVIGKIQIKGANVTAGYYNNFSETVKVTKPDNWLDTGDLGFYKGRNLYVTGRSKDIIFSNGQNFYPHDLERVAEKVPGVELNKIVFGGLFNLKLQQEEIICFVFFRGSLENFIPLSNKIKMMINQKIGLVVDKILPINSVPRTTSGKLQRFKLLSFYHNGHFDKIESKINQLSEESYGNNKEVSQPESSNEIKLHQIWTTVLGQTTIGIDQGFFEIGGNSLKAAEIIMGVRKEFEVEVPLDLLYQNTTIRALAKTFSQYSKYKHHEIPIVDNQREYPISNLQKGLYYNWEMNKSTLAYNIPVAFKIKGAFDVKKMEAGIQELITRNDSLRIYFNRNETLTFSVSETVDFTLKCIDFSGKDLDKKLRSLIRPFDLKNCPLFRIELLKLQDYEHILFADFHHSVSDGISVVEFVNNLMMLYHDKEIIDVRIGYKDFSLWAAEKSKSVNVTKAKKFWLEQLRGEIPILNLPLDYVRPKMFDPSGGRIKLTLSKDNSDKLRKIALEQKCTLSTLMLAIYRLLLYKYSGQEDVLIGIPVHGRTHPDLLDVHGMFVNNLIIRNPIKAKGTISELIKMEKEMMSTALNHQEYPFESLVENINSERDVSRNVLFDTMFIFHNISVIGSQSTELSIYPYFFDPGISKFDLSFEVFDEGVNTLKCYVEYSSSLFHRKTAINFSKHFENLVTELIKNPEKRLSEFTVLSKIELGYQLLKFNDTSNGEIYDIPVHILFEKQVLKEPYNIAIEYNEEKITYAELNNKANYLAKHLKDNGVGSQNVVAILLEKSPEFIISVLAVLKAGGCYLPIDTSLPKERVNYLISDSGSEVIITIHTKELVSSRFNAKFKGSIIDLQDLFSNDVAITFDESFEDINTLAYILYTSGTTGNPKGVMVGHKSLSNYVGWAAKTYGNNSSLNFPLFTSVSFDLTITSIFTPLVTGNKIIIFNDKDQLESLGKLLKDKLVDVIKLTPSHLKIMRDYEIGSIVKSRVKKLILGGEALNSSLAQEIYNKFDQGIEIYNEYGPTEATIGCMIYKFNPEDKTNHVPIGSPIDHCQIYVLDNFLNPVPNGVHGELYISGTCLSQGYFKDENLTALKFVPNPFLPGQKMYKTGDIARRNISGNLEYIGRFDQQVKINGYRIELPGIEHHLKSYDGIEDCTVTTKYNKKGDKILVGYYKNANVKKYQISAIQLVRYLSKKLPFYMVPSQFIQIEAIPLTQNGKVNYKALNSFKLPSAKAEVFSEPSTIEKETIKIWEEILNEKGIGVRDNFYELGGDSIKAVQIATRLNEKGMQIAAKDILILHTIEQIGLRSQELGFNFNSYNQKSTKGEMGLMPIQSWFFGNNFANPHFYNQSVFLRFNCDINTEALEKSFKKMIDYHDGLRLNYDQKKNKMFYNRAHLNPKLTIKSYQISSTDNSELERVCNRLKSNFNINESLLINAAFLKKDKSFHGLFITAHHLLVDGISWRILLEDLSNIYRSITTGVEIKLPNKTASLKDWEAQLSTFSQTVNIHNERYYWNQIAKKEFSIPKDFHTTDWKVEKIKKVKGIFNKELTEFLKKEVQKIYRTSILTILSVSLARTMKEWTKENHFIVEMENHGRHVEGIALGRTVGWFTSMYPVELSLKETDIRNQIKVIKEQLESVPNDGMGYGINTFFRKGKSESQTPRRFPIRFNYLGEFGKEFNNELFTYLNLDTGVDSDITNQMTTELELNIMIINDGLHLDVSYNDSAYRSKTIHWFVNAFFFHLEEVLLHIKKKGEVYLTPSDFQTVGLDQEELDVLFE